MSPNGGSGGLETEILIEIRGELRGHGVTLTQVLGAVVAGNERRDERFDALESRVSRLEHHVRLEP